MKRIARAAFYALLLTLALNAPTIAGNVGLDHEAIIQVLNGLGITTNGVYSGGGPWTRTSTTISPTTAGDTLSLTGVTTWPTGLNLGPNSGQVVGPSDEYLVINGPANGDQGVSIEGNADPINYEQSFVSVTGTGNGASANIYAGLQKNGDGGVVQIGAVTGLGNGAHDGYIQFAAGLLPYSQGYAAIGSSSLGYSKLYLDYTNTATVGTVHIDKATGRVNLGAGQSTFTVTDSLVTAGSHIFLNAHNAPGNAVAVMLYAVAGNGSFTVNAVPAVTNQTAIDFLVVGAD